MHALPHNETTATIFIEGVNGKLVETLDINISDYDPLTDTHKITWAIRNSNGASKLNYLSKDCKTGAAQVGAAGRIIAFGSFFGCVPCAFVGGAISALGAAGYLACSINR